MSTKQDVVSEARAIEEPVAAKRAWGPVLRGEARARLARYDAAVKREADLCAADPKRPRGQLLLVVDREVFAALLARLDALAPLAEAAGVYGAAFAAWIAAHAEAQGDWSARHAADGAWAALCARETRAAGALLRSDDALRRAARGER